MHSLSIRRFAIPAALTLITLNSLAQADKAILTVTNTEVKTIAAKALADPPFRILITLPQGYDPAAPKTYPVVYYTDAFLYAEAIIGSSKILQLDRKRIQPFILVGISYEGDFTKWMNLRLRDLIPYYLAPDKAPKGLINNPPPNNGQAQKFLAFMKDELFPFIDREYRTDISSRTLMGHSGGGLFGSWILATQPELFQNYLIGSPALWWADYAIKRDFELGKAKLQRAKANIMIASGSVEIKEILDSHQLAVDYFTKPEFSGLTVKHKLYEGESHISINNHIYTAALREFFKQ